MVQVFVIVLPGVVTVCVGSVPVPDSETEKSGVFEPLTDAESFHGMSSVALRDPSAVGAKCIWIVQLPPGLTVAPAHVSVPMLKSPALAPPIDAMVLTFGSGYSG